VTKKMKKILVFDMDGTIVDLYAVDNWLEMLQAENPAPYRQAEPLVNMNALVRALNALKERAGYKVQVITWGSKDSSDSYLNAVHAAKLEWLNQYEFPLDDFICLPYGTPKEEYLPAHALGVIFDDSEEVRRRWLNEYTVNPLETDIVTFLQTLADRYQ
jgi:hypothetical protein